MASSASPRPLAQCAVVVSAKDNVAIVKTNLAAGDVVALPDGRTLAIRGEVTPGHRFATRDVPAGTFVLQYGQPIGTSRGITAGDPISHANMSNEVPVVRNLPATLHNPAPDYVPKAQRATFRGFLRDDGRVGTRNFVLIVPTSMCSSHEALQIATIAEYAHWSRARFPNVDGVVALPHNKGCG